MRNMLERIKRETSMPDNFTPLTHEEIEKSLTVLPKRIYDQGIICVNLKEEWMLLKAEYTLEQARVLITNKAKDKNLTVAELKLSVIKDTYELRLKCIKAEATHNRAEVLHKELDDKFAAVRKLVEFLKVTQERG